ncbi:hypothetical protein [uncultured Lacinutrix sp.]|uniref:hypothetical protein n=1 Tax=uncultured Lacinutrix sp. TaxID=574032 RepID=UPI00260B05E9|nr:hypothetical protein [uncultured Lacinutrix sp.]
MELHVNEHQLRVANLTTTTAEGWKVTTKKGRISGVGVSVSGSGAYANMVGSFSFELKRMESSKTYNKMVKEYNISGGVGGFFAWLGFRSNASTHKKEIQESFKEMASSEKVKGKVNINMMVSGQYPNVQVDASAYILVLQLTDDQGNTTSVFSNNSPSENTGAQDSNGNNLPDKDNNSTIDI